MAVQTQNVILNNGQKMPIFGLGTFLSAPQTVTQAVKDAIDAGYRSIDCAYIYQNENEVGEGIAAKIGEGVVKREDLFVTSKLWNTFHSPNLVRGALEETLKNLRLDYLDLFLIHWPTGFQEGGDLQPVDADGNLLFSDVDYVDTWKAMEKLVEDGLVKSIGVSNFTKKQLERVFESAKIIPAVNQVECHPYYNQSKLINFLKTKNIKLMAYSPLGSPGNPYVDAGKPALLDDPKVLAIAQKYNKLPAHVVLRYQIQRGVIVIPKSTTKSRIASNFDVFDFELSKEDFDVIDNLDKNERYVELESWSKHPHYPFNDEF